MTNEEILEQQVDALEKLLQIKQAIIEEHEQKISRLQADRSIGVPGTVINTPWIGHPQPLMPQPGINIPSFWPVDPCSAGGGHHDFPYPWFSTQPACCTKCGKAAPNYSTTSTCNSTTGDNVLTLTTAANK